VPFHAAKCQPKSDMNIFPIPKNALPAVSAETPAPAASGLCSLSDIVTGQSICYFKGLAKYG
jgi:hypothetical protein